MSFDLEKNIARVLTEKYGGVETPEYAVDVERLKAGEPVAYVLGYEDFLGARVDMAERPMVPRPETAHWVMQVVEDLKDKGAVRIFEGFAGAGGIGLALLKHLPQATVEFSELDENLCKGIERSVVLNGFEERAKVLPGGELSRATGLYDAIVANPPYIDPVYREELDPDMQEYEPALAFFAGKEGDGGTHFHRLLIAEAGKFLKPGGRLYFEADADQKPVLEELLRGTDWHYEFRMDQYGQVRFPVLTKGEK